MRQLNFAVIFATVLLLVLFALENTNNAAINIVGNVKIELPIVIELIVAMGLGATLAWFFSLWSKVQNVVEFRNKNRQIQELEQQVAQLNNEVEERKRLVAGAAIDVEVEERHKEESK